MNKRFKNVLIFLLILLIPILIYALDIIFALNITSILYNIGTPFNIVILLSILFIPFVLYCVATLFYGIWYTNNLKKSKLSLSLKKCFLCILWIISIVGFTAVLFIIDNYIHFDDERDFLVAVTFIGLGYLILLGLKALYHFIYFIVFICIDNCFKWITIMHW